MTDKPAGSMPFTDRLAVSIANIVIGWRWLVLLISLLLVAGSASGLRQLEFVNNYRIFFSPENPELVAFDHFQNTYTKNDNALFVLVPREGDVFSADSLAAVERLTEAAWTLPFAIRVDSITNFQHSRGVGNQLIVTDLVENLAELSVDELAELREIALGEPLLRGYLIADEASATGVNVTLQFPERTLTEVPDAMEAVRALAQEIREAYPNIEVGVTGGLPMNAAFAEATIIDGTTLYPIMLAILVVVTGLILRSIVGTIATLLVVIFSTLSAVGIAGYAGWPVTPVSGSAPIIILTLAIADSIHILISMFGLMRDGSDKIAALKESIRINFLAVTVTSITTMIGFLALNFTDTPPFHHLGNVTAVGIAAAWLYSLTFLPALVAILPVRVKLRDVAGHRGAMTMFAGFVVRRHKPILVGVGTVAVILIALVPTIELNDDWVAYFHERLEFRRDAEFAREHLTGLYLIEYSVPASGGGGINEPEYLHNLDGFATWLRDQPEVLHVFSYTDIARRLNRNMHGDDPDWFRIPDDRRLAAQYLLLYELSLPYGLDLKDRISVDQSSTRVTATLDNVPTVQVREFIGRSSDWIADHAPAYMMTEATGPTVMFAYISQRNIRAMLGGNAMALILIAGIMVLTMRSLALGGLSLIPNAIPILMTFGVWALLVGQVGLAAATVSATSLGIIVDNTVHYLTKYLRARRENGLSRRDAVIYAFETVGLAILANAIILTTGFAVLAFSTFKVTAEMGLLTAIAIVIALAIDFLLLPALLLLGDDKSRTESHAEIST